MLVSLKWLNTYLDRPIDADAADEVLTRVGFPLDGREERDDDVLLDVEVTSNRPDVLSHVGVAREVAAGTGRRLQMPAMDIPEPDIDQARPVDQVTDVDNQAVDLCPAYTARVICGVRVAPSPPWLVERLESIGLRSVNNVVDVTNFVLHELGQPLHAFDLNLLHGKRIVVRQAAQGEPMTTIDGTRHQLNHKMLVIADADRPVAVAGVMGGLDSEVGEQTTDILLESARFDPLSVRTTSRALKLSSDSSYRFERGVDPQGLETASRRACQLILQLAGGRLCAGMISVPEIPSADRRELTLRPDRCNGLMGYDLSTETMVDYLDRLDLQPRLHEGLITCAVPSYRLDLDREVDLIEEVARVHGFDQLEVREKIALVIRKPQPAVQARAKLAELLVGCGYYETVTFANLSKSHAQAFAGQRQLVKVADDHKRADPWLRPSVLPSLLVCRKANQDAGNKEVALFEVGSTFGYTKVQYVEQRVLAMIADAEDAQQALRRMRGALELLCSSLGRADVQMLEADSPCCWAILSGHLVDGEGRVFGHWGLVDPKVLGKFDVKTPQVAAELDYQVLTAHYPPQVETAELPKYPAIERDLSIIVDESISWAQINDQISQVDPELLERVQFVTTFRGKPIAGGKKSVTFRMTYRHAGKTLRHDEVDPQVQSVINRLVGTVGATIREC